MNTHFDPYHTWLGIPPNEQPANHYRLLGLQTFESDSRVIENAADRQMSHLRTVQSGQNSADCQRILNEVAAARICLLDGKKRSAYDEHLRRSTLPASGAADNYRPVPSIIKLNTTTKPRQFRVAVLTPLILGGIGVVFLSVLAIQYATGIDLFGLAAKKPANPPIQVAGSSVSESRPDKPKPESATESHPVTPASKEPVNTSPTPPAPTNIEPTPNVPSLVLVPKGAFMMGAGNDEDALPDERPSHRVVVAKPFYISRYEITVEQFKRFVESTHYVTSAEQKEDPDGGWGYNAELRDFARPPGKPYSWQNVGFQQERFHPVVNVSWYDASAYCEWLTKELGGARRFRLPTEVEWEYACRGGSASVWSFGNDASGLQKHANVADQSLMKMLRPDTVLEAAKEAASWDDGHPFASMVGAFRPNKFGIHDMHGNVAEWCLDEYREDAYSHHEGDSTVAPTAAAPRVFRGGSWGYAPVYSRSARRHKLGPADRWANIGFRVVCELAGE